MERAIKVMNNFADKVNEERANGKYGVANDYLDMLCGAMCVFNEYEAGNKRWATLEEVNNMIKVVIVEEGV